MKPQPIVRRVESHPYQTLFERACPGPVDRPHRGAVLSAVVHRDELLEPLVTPSELFC